MARATGLEPATSGVTGRHSNRLSYARFPVPPRRTAMARMYGARGALSSASSHPGAVFLVAFRMRCFDTDGIAGFITRQPLVIHALATENLPQIDHEQQP
jgi:hypothetical protein